MNDRRMVSVAALAGVAISLAGCIILARVELQQIRAAFETDARIVHRLFSQRTAQQDAIMAMLALLQPETRGSSPPGPRISAVYPQILELQRREAGSAWSGPALQSAETESRNSRRAAIAEVDFAAGRYRLVHAADPSSYAATIDLRAMVPREEWPLAEQSPVLVALEHGSQRYVVQAGDGGRGPWRFEFRKRLAADSQPFDAVLTRSAGWAELPWLKMLAWTLATAAIVAALLALARQRAARRRAEELLRLGQVARLNTLGELAAGMAHELNQPLTAIIAGSQTAKRLLDEDPPDLATMRDAMQRTVEQARRAADVIGRMRRAVERPEIANRLQPVRLQDALRNALYLLEPESARLGVQPVISGDGLTLLAEPVALEQIIHNLLANALQALAQVPPGERALQLTMRAEGRRGVLSVSDSGPGIPAELLPRIFEPFFTTRNDGLGLGLSLCESLAAEMNGRLSAAPAVPRGAVLHLELPLADAA